MKRYNVPITSCTVQPMTQAPDGEYIKYYTDLLEMLQLISDTDPDLTPRTAVIGALIDFATDV